MGYSFDPVYKAHTYFGCVWEQSVFGVFEEYLLDSKKTLVLNTLTCLD